MLSQSGLKYISISPESGSLETKKEIGKRFDNDHAFELIKWCKKNTVTVQACFVLGMPGEKRRDRKATAKLIRKLTIKGVDEIALFIITPIPGSQVFSKTKEVHLTDVSFSPTWRIDYKKLSRIRIFWYLQFLLLKLICHPIPFILTVLRFFTNKFELKMELAPYRSQLWKKWSLNETDIFRDWVAQFEKLKNEWKKQLSACTSLVAVSVSVNQFLIHFKDFTSKWPDFPDLNADVKFSVEPDPMTLLEEMQRFNAMGIVTFTDLLYDKSSSTDMLKKESVRLHRLNKMF
jgi:hypothetical protein